MRLTIILITLLLAVFWGNAQKSRYDSFREIMRRDSIEYEQQLRDADRIKNQTDSMLKNDLGNIERITPGPDSAVLLENLRLLAAQELERQRAEETKKYYFIAGAFAVLLIAVIVVFKRKQLAQGDGKKP
jgi:hypothetical protein